ncbi:hypothetical protein NP493_1882g00010 [Ridgeia piscesae]|uniref:Secreted protein n=1 Tax=Ridgeia piscesae TaxID=27915 RepID=A0AAD9JQF6_RIDPI|nr:hypothetical protein NP493_1882g00010 [Ridgeia piscesae]
MSPTNLLLVFCVFLAACAVSTITPLPSIEGSAIVVGPILESRLFLQRFYSKRNQWDTRFCRMTCSRCDSFMSRRYAALCHVECTRGAGRAYMACLIVLMEVATK